MVIYPDVVKNDQGLPSDLPGARLTNLLDFQNAQILKLYNYINVDDSPWRYFLSDWPEEEIMEKILWWT